MPPVKSTPLVATVSSTVPTHSARMHGGAAQCSSMCHASGCSGSELGTRSSEPAVTPAAPNLHSRSSAPAWAYRRNPSPYTVTLARPSVVLDAGCSSLSDGAAKYANPGSAAASSKVTPSSATDSSYTVPREKPWGSGGSRHTSSVPSAEIRSTAVVTPPRRQRAAEASPRAAARPSPKMETVAPASGPPGGWDVRSVGLSK